MKRLVTRFAVALILLMLMPFHPSISVANPSIGARSGELRHFAPPLNDTVPTLVPPPILIPRAPSLAPGARSLLVIAVEFTNQLHTKTIPEVEQMIFTDVNRYYQEVSYGKISLSGKVVGWYNMNKTIGSYGRDGLAIDDPNGDGSPDSWLLIQDAINAADKDLDFTQYGYVMVLHAGFGQETSQNPNDLWSCAYIWGIWFKTRGGQAYSHATIVPELEDRGAVPMGVIAHEFGHEIGLPDLYDPYGQKDYLGKFDLMSKGIYNGAPAASSPAHPISWNKIQLSWIEPNQISTVEKGARANTTLNPLEKTGTLLVLRVPINERQYYLVEVRQRIGFDLALPAVGVLISYVDESYSGGGKVRLVDSNPLTATLDDAPYQIGQTFSDVQNQISISVLSLSGQNYQVYVDRGSPQSDLTISFSGMDPQRARRGQVVTFTFLLSNQGTLSARDFRVLTLIDSMLVNTETHTVEAGSNRILQFGWNATIGVHRIEVKIDPDNVLGEFNRANNQLAYQFIVGSILSIRLPWDNGAAKVNGTNYSANSSGTVDIPVLPGPQTIEVALNRIISPGKERLSFVRWIDGDTSNPRIYNVSDDATLVAVYRTEYRLTLQGNQGTTTGEGWYNKDAIIVVEAKSPTMLSGGKTRLTFLQWSGDVVSNKTSISLKMDLWKNITAVWSREHYLTILSTFSSTEKQGWYREGDRVIVSATGTVDHGNGTQRVFVSWSGNVSSDRSRIELTMSAPQMISATYRTEYELVITSERGSVGGRKWFSAGERIKISVSREIVEGEVRYLFVKWEGAIQTESNEATVTMDAPRSVTAIWKTQYRITLAVSGVPNGTSVSVMINGQENQGSAPYSFSGWFDSGSKLAFETAVTIETVTYEYSLEGWRNSAGEWVTSPRVLNGPATLRTIYVSRPKGLLNYLISAFGTDKLSEIILLKNARDSILSKTFSGRHLVYYFDVACHTILPNFASQLSNSPATKTLFILTVYPLMKALAVPAMLFEFGVPMTDFSFLIFSLIGAFLIGLIYLFPVLALLAYLTRKRAPNLINRSLKPLLIIWIVSVQMVIFAEIVSAPLIVAAATLSYLGLGATLSAALATLLLTRIVQISNKNEATYSSWNTKSLSENAYACSTQ